MAGSLILPITTMFNDKGLKQAQKSFGQFGGAIKGVLGAAGLTVGLSAFVNGIQDATKAAVEDAKSQALLANQLKNTVGATKAVTASVEDQIQKMSLASSVADDKIRPAYAMLIRSTGKVKDATRLTNLALDISAATGKDVETVAKALGRAYNGSAGALGKLGIKVKDTKHPFDELEKAFAGSAETAAKNDPYQRLSVIFGEISETVGTAFIPALNDLADWFTENFDGIKKFFEDAFNSDVFRAVADLGKTIYQEVFIPIGEFLASKTFQEAFDKFSTGFTSLADGIKSVLQTSLVDFLLTIGGAAVTGGLQVLGKALKAIGSGLKIISLYEDTFLMVTGQKAIPTGDAKTKQIKTTLGLLGDVTGINFDDLIEGFSNIPGYASGGIVPATPGGQLSLVGEGGQAEAIIPLDRLDRMMKPSAGVGAVYNITVNAGVGDKAAIGKAVVEAVKVYEKQSGAGWRQ